MPNNAADPNKTTSGKPGVKNHVNAVIIADNKNKVPETIVSDPKPKRGLLNDEKTVFNAIKSKITL